MPSIRNFRVRTLFISLLIGCIFFTSSTSVVNAQIPVTDVASIKVEVLTYVEDTITAVQQLAATTQQFYEWAESFALASLKKKLIDGLSDKIINYTKGSGVNGGQKFVTNWQSYLSDASTKGAESAASNIASTALCSSFGDSLRLALGENKQSGTSGSGDTSLECDFAPGELEAIAADPSKGSWRSYQKSLEPQNNFAGAYWDARIKIDAAALEAREAAQNEAVAGGGFLSAKSDGAITTPGSVIKDLTSRAAASDIDLIVNAEQLKDLLGGLGTSLISELTKGNDSGISGVNVSARRTARNNTRTTDGKRIENNEYQPDCSKMIDLFGVDENNDGELDASERSWAMGKPTDENGNGKIDQAEKDHAAGLSEQGIIDLCDDNRTAQTGGRAVSQKAIITELLTRRREAKKFLKDQIDGLDKKISTLKSYLTTVSGSGKAYSPFAVNNLLYVAGKSGIDGKKKAYAKRTYKSACFNPLQSSDFHDKLVINGENFRRAWLTYTDDLTQPEYVPGQSDPRNDTFGKDARCTYLDRSEIDFYEDVVKKRLGEIYRGNNQAIEKLDTLNKYVTKLATTGKASDRSANVQRALDEFNCMGKPNSCFIPDPLNGFLQQIGFIGDQDVTSSGYTGKDISGYYTDEFRSAWVQIPNYANESVNYYDSEEEVSKTITLSLRGVIKKLNLKEDVAAWGIVSTGNGNASDDPSNPVYEPAFDPHEADLVYQIAKGDLSTLNTTSADAPEEVTSPDDPDETVTVTEETGN